jgi:hypothetical protein
MNPAKAPIDELDAESSDTTVAAIELGPEAPAAAEEQLLPDLDHVRVGGLSYVAAVGEV